MVDNLDDGSELSSEGTAADQDEAANLDQLPRSELDIDIGHGESFLQENHSALEPTEGSVTNALTVDNRGWDESGGLLSREVGLSKLTLRISDVPTHFSLNGPLPAGLGLAYLSTRIIISPNSCFSRFFSALPSVDFS